LRYTPIEHARDHGYLVAGGGKIFHNGHEDWSVFSNGGKRSYGPKPSHGPFAVSAPRGPIWKRWVPHPDFAQMRAYNFYCPLSQVPHTAGHHGWGIGNGSFSYRGLDDRDLMPDEQVARWATRWLQQDAPSDQPWLLCIGINRPHAPPVVPDRYFERFPPDQLQVMPTLAGDVADTAPELQPPEPDTWTTGGLHHYQETMARDGDLRLWTQAYLACVSFVDEQVGQVLTALANSPHADRTLVIFTSDHGYHMGEKQRLFKNTVWEPSTAIPLIIAGPKLPRSADVHRPVSLIDLYPTILEAAGLPSQRGDELPPLDGHSLLGLCRDPHANWTGPSVAISTVPPDSRPARDIRTAIGQQHWSVRGKRYRSVLGNRGGEELYDLHEDPHEWNNRAGEPKLAEVQTRLRQELMRLTGRAE